MSTDLAIVADKPAWMKDPAKLELVKATICKGATDDQLQLFLHACERSRLDPLMKQIYAVLRFSKKDNCKVMSIQTGIDGFRLIADRTGQYAGNDDPIYQVVNNMPTQATVTVWKIVGGLRCAFTATARWSEYVQEYNGQPSQFWAKMPFLMIAKVAESLALRKAFPAELSGLYTEDEMAQADNGRVTVHDNTPDPMDTPQLEHHEKMKAVAQAIDPKPVGSNAASTVTDTILEYRQEVDSKSGEAWHVFTVEHSNAVYSTTDPMLKERLVGFVGKSQEAKIEYQRAGKTKEGLPHRKIVSVEPLPGEELPL